jgi:hypothetical protein
MRFASLIGASAPLVAAGCAPALTTAHAPSELGHATTTAANVNHALVVEWNAQDRATIVSHMRAKTLVVAYDGATIAPLWQCRADGNYRYGATPVTAERAEVADSDRLRASVPALKVALGGSVQRDARVAVSLTVVGRYDNSVGKIRREDLHDDDCAKATHFVAAVTVGAYHFESDVKAAVGASVEVVGKVGVEGSSASQKKLVHGGGNEDACKAAGAKDAEPPRECDSVLRLELQPLVEGGAGMSTQAKVGIGVGAAGLAGVGVGAAFGLLARGTWNDAKAGCDTAGCDPASVDKGKTARTQANVSTAALAVGGTAVAGGVVLLITGSGKKPAAKKVGVSPSLDPRAPGLSLSGEF